MSDANLKFAVKVVRGWQKKKTSNYNALEILGLCIIYTDEGAEKENARLLLAPHAL
jgi:hypothetical protein